MRIGQPATDPHLSVVRMNNHPDPDCLGTDVLKRFQQGADAHRTSITLGHGPHCHAALGRAILKPALRCTKRFVFLAIELQQIGQDLHVGKIQPHWPQGHVHGEVARADFLPPG